MTTQKRSFITALWDFFCSLKLSIFLLLILAITSIIGTVIQQNASMEDYLRAYSETTIRIFNALGFFDMYHSWWFMLLLYLLTINLIACSIKRLPRVWKMISEPTLIMDEGLEKSLTLTHDMKLAGDAETLRDRMTSFMTKEFAAPTITAVDGQYHLFAQKGPYARFGVYVVHLSIIIIFIGAIIGSFFGYKAFVNIVEGTGTDTVYTRTEKPINLGFTVRCEDFSVSFYDNGAPKEFKSLLTIIDNGQVVIKDRPIIVNDPLTYKGITFYQSSYGPANDGSGLYYLTVRSRNGGAPQQLSLRQGERAALPGGGTVQVLEATSEVSRFIPGFVGPAARIEVTAPGSQPESFIVFRNYPMFDEQRGGRYIFTYEGADEKMFTGLQVAKDPGVWVVWLGCALMVIGTYMAFFMSHRRLWIRVSRGHVTIGGTASKNPSGFQLFFDQLVEKAKQ